MRSLNGNPENVPERPARRRNRALIVDRAFPSARLALCVPMHPHGIDSRPIARKGRLLGGALARSRGASHVITRTPLVIDALARDERATRGDPPRIPRGRFCNEADKRRIE